MEQDEETDRDAKLEHELEELEQKPGFDGGFERENSEKRNRRLLDREVEEQADKEPEPADKAFVKLRNCHPDQAFKKGLITAVNFLQ